MSKIFSAILVIFLTLFLAALASLFFLASSTSAPSNLGIINGKLAPCPATPNCVSSEASDPQHFIAGITYKSSSSEEAYAIVKQLLLIQKNAKIITETNDYIYAQFTSQLLRFVDDVEFYFRPDAKIVDIRSASRVGESDLGVNRNRIEQIKAQLKLD